MLGTGPLLGHAEQLQKAVPYSFAMAAWASWHKIKIRQDGQPGWRQKNRKVATRQVLRRIEEGKGKGPASGSTEPAAEPNAPKPPGDVEESGEGLPSNEPEKNSGGAPRMAPVQNTTQEVLFRTRGLKPMRSRTLAPGVRTGGAPRMATTQNPTRKMNLGRRKLSKAASWTAGPWNSKGGKNPQHNRGVASSDPWPKFPKRKRDEAI